MRYNKPLVSALAAALILLGPAGAFAKDHDSAVTLNQLQQATTSMPQAIATAEAQTNGTADGCKVRLKNGVLTYKVETTESGKSTEIVINANTGAVVSAEKPGFFESMFEENDEGGAMAVSLQKAIGIAETAVGGKVVQVERDDEDKAANYEVTVVAADGQHTLSIDGTSGAIVAQHLGDGEDHND